MHSIYNQRVAPFIVGTLVHFIHANHSHKIFDEMRKCRLHWFEDRNSQCGAVDNTLGHDHIRDTSHSLLVHTKKISEQCSLRQKPVFSK